MSDNWDGARLQREKRNFIESRLRFRSVYLRPFNLAIARLAAHLLRRVKQQARAACADGMATANQAAAPVDGATPAGFNRAVFHRLPAWAEPALRCVAAAKAQGVQLAMPRPGEKFEFDQPFENQAWYLPPPN